MTPKPRFPAFGRVLIQILAATTLFGTAAHAQNLLETANPGFEENFGFFGIGSAPTSVNQWNITRNDDWVWISSGDGQGNPRTGGATARLSNSALSTLASSRPAAIPGESYTFKVWATDVSPFFQNFGSLKLQFFDNNTGGYIPLALGEFSEPIAGPDYNNEAPGGGYQEFTVTGFAPTGATHVGVVVESFGYALNVDDASLVADSAPPQVIFVSDDLNFTGGNVVVGDVGSAQVNPAGVFVFTLDGTPLTTSVSKVDGVTTVAFNSPINDNVTYNYTLQVPLIGGGTQSFTGDIRSFYIPQTLPGVAGGLGSWGIREYGAIAGNLADSAGIAKAATEPFVEATRPVFNATDPDSLNVRNLGNFNNDIAIVSNAPEDQNWVVVGKTVVNVPAPGIYTFSVHSDDGFAMRVSGPGGGRFLRTRGGGAVDPADDTSIFLNQSTPETGVRGIYQFDAAGTYSITYLGWDGGGSGHYEVAWAAGEFTFERQTDTWTLVGNPTDPLVTAQPYRQPYPANLPGPGGAAASFGVRSYLNVSPLNNVGNAMDFLAATTRLPDGIETFDASVAAINHRDPDNGGEGIFPGDSPFPGDMVGTNDDNVVTIHKGRVRVANAGDYTFLCNGDDGFFFRIKGVNGNPNPGFHTASQVGNNQDGRWTMSNRNELFFAGGTGNANTRGVINLAAGDYDLEFVHFEINGGFNYELGVAAGSFLHGTEPPAGFRLVGDAPDGLELVAAPAGNFRITSVTTTGNPVSSVALTFASQDSLTYGIEASTNLAGWTVIATAIDGQAVSTVATVNVAALPAFFGQPRVFFRVFEE